MRKYLIPRFFLLLVIFSVVFIVLVHIQFANKNTFTIRSGDLVIQGNYGPGSRSASNSYPVTGPISIYFGGMEFIIEDTLELRSSLGNTSPILVQPQYMTIMNNEVHFLLDQGPELIFTTQYTWGAIELVIRADFTAYSYSADHIPVNYSEIEPEPAEREYHSIRIKFKPLQTSIVQRTEQSLIFNSEGINYIFNRDTEADRIVLETRNPAISYRVLPDREAASPWDFITPAALDDENYEGTLTLWLDQVYLLWNRAFAAPGVTADGELISAYMTEAIRRGAYRSAVAAVSASWDPANLFYEASAYIGRFDTALRSLSAEERERTARLARLFNERSSEFLKDFRIIQFLAIRGYNNLIDDAAEILRSFDPAVVTVEHAAGILEGSLDWDRYRPGRYNPYSRFVDQALFVITASLRQNPRSSAVPSSRAVLAFTGTGSTGNADIELNLRLGNALIQFDDETKIALGKTLILSVLSLEDREGNVPLYMQENFTESAERYYSQQIYRICFAGENYARSQIIGSGIWAWTAASSVSGDSSADRLNITVNFPAGETHYLMIRGIRPFSSILISDIILNQNNQFERFDASGWSYSSTEQTLLVKLRHRLPAERISIVY